MHTEAEEELTETYRGLIRIAKRRHTPASMAEKDHVPRPNIAGITATEIRPADQARPGILATNQAPSREIGPIVGS